jgi:hypothetical protein
MEKVNRQKKKVQIINHKEVNLETKGMLIGQML